MSDLILFDFDSGACRFGRDDDGTPWVVASDFAKLMGYRDARDAARLLDDAERGTQKVRTPGGDQQMTVFYEDGIWELIFRSTLPGAKAVKARVKAILREIRETGSYAATDYDIPKDYPSALELAAKVLRELEASEQARRELEPAANSWAALADAGGDYSLRQAAQILDRDPSIQTGQNRLAAYLRGLGWLDRNGEPYQRAVDAGRMTRRATGGYEHPDRSHIATWQCRITPKGLHELHRLLGGSGALLLAARPDRSAS